MKSLNIGVVAYGINPDMVMVRVPNEKGRWLLTDRCVVEVDCPVCYAVAGEPCRHWMNTWKRGTGGSGWGHRVPPPAECIRYGVGVHVRRKEAAQVKFGGGQWAARRPPHKIRLSAHDLADLQQEPPEPAEPEPEPPYVADFTITRKEPPHGSD